MLINVFSAQNWFMTTEGIRRHIHLPTYLDRAQQFPLMVGTFHVLSKTNEQHNCSICEQPYYHILLV